MCSQPPKDVDDSHLVDENLRLVSLVPPTTRDLTITGGEPTLLGDRLFEIIEACRDRLPVTRLHVLTNGRMFSYRSIVKRLAQARHPQLTLGIPLYSDHCVVHDYVVQAQGAFDQTMVGLHNLARFKQNVEIRVVVHKQTFARLPQLAQFIYRNCPFAGHVAIMGLELMGYTKTNLKQLWIDPVEYQSQLEDAVMFLAAVGMNVSIYNHQLCVLPRSVWPYAKKSISDFKNIYLDECQRCSVVDACGGLFRSAEKIHSKHIAAIA
jgi:His-Xaa-Ser system radical SAM maturase HxsC